MLENQMDKETETCMQLQIDVAKLENIYLTKKEKYDSLQMEYKDLVIDEEKQDLEDSIKENPMAIQSIKVDFKKKEWYRKNISNKTFDEIFDECYVPTIANVSKKQTIFKKIKYILKRVVGKINE